MSRSEHDLLKDPALGLDHDLFNDPLGRVLVRNVKLGEGDAETIGELQRRVTRLRRQLIFGDVVPFRKPRLQGEICVGEDWWGRPAHIPVQLLASGLIVLASIGAGKSCLLMHFLRAVAQHCSVWISEQYKQEIGRIIPLLHQNNIPAVILPYRNWPYNILQAGDRDPGTHLSVTIDVLCRTLGLPFTRARSLLRQAGFALYERFNIWNGQRDEWPCLYDLVEEVRQSNGHAASKEAIIDRLVALLLALGPKCAAYRRAYDPSDLRNHTIVYQFLGAPESVKHLLQASSLAAVFQRDAERGVSNARIGLWAVFEDALRLFRDRGSDTSALDELSSVTRGMGTGIGVIVQTLHGVSRSLLPHLTTRIMGRLITGEDHRQAASLLSLNAEQVEWARKHCAPGMFILAAAEGAEPFPIRVPLPQLAPAMTEQEIAATRKPLEQLPLKPADEFQDWRPYPSITVQATALDERETAFLRLVMENTGEPSSWYGQQLGLSGSAASKIRKHLVIHGYLREHKLATGKRGRNAIVLEARDKAKDYFQNCKTP